MRRTIRTAAAVVLAAATQPNAAWAEVAWIANQLDGTVSRIDLSSHEAVTLPVGALPLGIAVSSDGSRAYVTNVEDGTVTVIDGITPAVIDTLPVGPFPRGIAVTPNGEKVYVAVSDGRVAVIDAATLAIGPTIALIPPESWGWIDGMAVNPAGTRVYVAKQESSTGSVAVIDTASDALVADVFLTFGESVQRVAVSADGTRVWATISGLPSVAEIDAATSLWTRDLPLDCPVFCAPGESLVAHPDGGRLYVAVALANRLAVIDLEAGDEVASIELAGAPSGVDVTLDGSRLYLPTLGGSDRIQIVDTTSQAVIGTLLAVGQGPAASGRFISAQGTTSVPPPPVLDASGRQCQDAIVASWKRFPAKLHKTFAGCFKRLLADVASGDGSAAAAAACDKALDPSDPKSTFARLRATARAQIVASCGAVTPAALAQPCDEDATTIGEVADCALDAQTRHLTETLAAEHGASCGVATAAGLAAAFPGLCATP